jgi:excisionase family DNA binding protein
VDQKVTNIFVAPDKAQLLRPEEAFRILNVSRTAGWRLITSGVLRSLKIGGSRRIPRVCLEELIESRLKSAEAA